MTVLTNHIFHSFCLGYCKFPLPIAEYERRKRHELERVQKSWLKLEQSWQKFEDYKAKTKEKKRAKEQAEAERRRAESLKKEERLKAIKEYHRQRYLKDSC